MSFNFTTGQLEALDDCLETLHWDTESRCVLLADSSGQFISKKGEIGDQQMAILSALAAAQLSATQEVARLIGENSRFNLLQEGQEQSVYLQDIDANLLLVLVFKSQTQLGMVRMVLRQTVERIRQIASEARVPTRVQDGLADSDFTKMLVDSLDDMFV